MDQLPKEISAAEFKAKCLNLMDRVENDRTEVVITKRGKPVAKLVPYDVRPLSVFGYMAGTALIRGEVMSPIDENWAAEHE
jgi:prevent-host-death family protein